MSVEHPTCPHCEEPLDKIDKNGVFGIGLCGNSRCPGKRSDFEDLEPKSDSHEGAEDHPDLQ